MAPVVYVLTKSYNSLPLRDGCLRLVGDVPLLVGERCRGRYLVVEKGRGVRAATGQAAGSVVYVASGPPRKVVVEESVLRIEDGLDLFDGFVKKGLWRELESAFFAAVARYASRCIYCTALAEATFLTPPHPRRGSGMLVEVVRQAKTYRVLVVSAPGHSDVFKREVERLFRLSVRIHAIRLGIPLDAPLDLYAQSRPATAKPAHVVKLAETRLAVWGPA
ncbi:hypothetical protein Pogu_1495 [Pyrobaculum oguniense TE7]|uniref:Uncharacterized protein n=1 Tax=Pyrobaculum oguniense (strain DSM 13380 / JCM 10595 / TE7) TaxID=698757 RepID=H6QC50_PYROT|nr:hypothetical protein Pogu_1495 [Pyrobaculum oguniense TE7]